MSLLFHWTFWRISESSGAKWPWGGRKGPLVTSQRVDFQNWICYTFFNGTVKVASQTPHCQPAICQCQRAVQIYTVLFSGMKHKCVCVNCCQITAVRLSAFSNVGVPDLFLLAGRGRSSWGGLKQNKQKKDPPGAYGQCAVWENPTPCWDYPTAVSCTKCFLLVFIAWLLRNVLPFFVLRIKHDK